MVSVKVKVSKGALRASRKALIPEGVPELLSSGHEGARTGRRGHSFRLRGTGADVWGREAAQESSRILCHLEFLSINFESEND